MSELIIRIIVAIVISIIAITFFVKYSKLIPDALNLNKETLIFFFALVTILVAILEPLFKKEKLPPDYINLNKPYIESNLIIDNVSKNAINFHFSIKNLGKLPAENISFNIYTDGSYSYENKTIYDRQLPPNGKMSYTPNFFIHDTKKENFIVIEFEIFYKAIIDNEKIDFRTLFNYRIPRINLKPNKFEYDSKNELKESKPDIDLKFISTHTDSILEGKQGGFSFTFNEKDQHENGITAFYSSPTKEILYDAKFKLIVFKILLDDRIIVLRKSFYKPGITFHNVEVSWNFKKKYFLLKVN